MKKSFLLFTPILLLFVLNVSAQGLMEKIDSIRINGKVYSALVQNGDTMILEQLEDIHLTSLRTFDSRDEYRRYLKYKRYAAIVYPYARDAINIMKKVEERTENMRRSKRKKYIANTYKQLENNFKNQLKKLTKIQGSILVKMIEKEMDESFYRIIKDKRNGFTAFYWNQLGKVYDYDLKRGYVPGDDKIMDAVLKDFDISYKENGSSRILSK